MTISEETYFGKLEHPAYARIQKSSIYYDPYGIGGRPLQDWMRRVVGSRRDLKYFGEVVDSMAFKALVDNEMKWLHEDEQKKVKKKMEEAGISLSKSEKFFKDFSLHCFEEHFSKALGPINRKSLYYPFMKKAAKTMVEAFDYIEKANNGDYYRTSQVFELLEEQGQRPYFLDQHLEDFLTWTEMVLKAYSKSKAHNEDFVHHENNYDKGRPDFAPLIRTYGKCYFDRIVPLVRMIRNIFGEEGLEALRSNINFLKQNNQNSSEMLAAVEMEKAVEWEEKFHSELKNKNGNLKHPDYITAFVKALKKRQIHTNKAFNIAGCPTKGWIKKVMHKGDIYYFNAVVDMLADANVRDDFSQVKKSKIRIPEKEVFFDTVIDCCLEKSPDRKLDINDPFLQKAASAMVKANESVEIKQPNSNYEKYTYTTDRVFTHLKDQVEKLYADKDNPYRAENARTLTTLVLEAYGDSKAHRDCQVSLKMIDNLLGKEEVKRHVERTPWDQRRCLANNLHANPPLQPLIECFGSLATIKDAAKFVGIVRETLGDGGLSSLQGEAVYTISESQIGTKSRAASEAILKAMHFEEKRFDHAPPRGTLMRKSVSILPDGFFPRAVGEIQEVH